MKIVIDISEKMYDDCKVRNTGHYSMYDFSSMIVNGTPLPKGHGNIYDENDIEKGIENSYQCRTVLDGLKLVKPVIETDRESEEK